MGKPLNSGFLLIFAFVATGISVKTRKNDQVSFLTLFYCFTQLASCFIIISLILDDSI